MLAPTQPTGKLLERSWKKRGKGVPPVQSKFICQLCWQPGFQATERLSDVPEVRQARRHACSSQRREELPWAAARHLSAWGILNPTPALNPTVGKLVYPGSCCSSPGAPEMNPWGL